MMKSDLRIVFMGTPDFAVPSLAILLQHGYEVVGVVTAPDRPAGRGRKTQQSAVKQFALLNKLKVLQPSNLRDEDFLSELKELNANLQVVVAFRMLPQSIWQLPDRGTFNLHASLLPNYRGAAPINWAIINGDSETGVTTFFIDKEIDTGKILFNEKVKIGAMETAGELHDRLMKTGAELALTTVEAIGEDKLIPINQDEFIASGTILKVAPKIYKQDCLIEWERTSLKVHNLIRGLSPYPAAFCKMISPEGKAYNIKVLKAAPLEADCNKLPGTIETDGKTYLHVCCGKGRVELLNIQLAGKKSLPIEDFLRGFSVSEDWHMT